MRRPIHSAVFAAAAEPAGSTGASAGPVTYTMDPGHTEVIATWNHFGFSRPIAMFYPVEGTLTYDADRPENSSVEVTIPLAGLHTTVARQDEHLRSAEYFDAAKFPEIRFKSTRVERGAAPDKLTITGDLTVRGITRSVVLDTTINKVGVHEMHKAQAAGFDATAHVNRSDFGMGAYVPVVSDRIDLRITTEVIESEAWKVILSKLSE